MNSLLQTGQRPGWPSGVLEETDILKEPKLPNPSDTPPKIPNCLPKPDMIEVSLVRYNPGVGNEFESSES